jgi:outer membrane protein assembly factor BamB
MSQQRLLTRTRLAHSIGIVAIGSLVFAGQAGDRPVSGTIWAANRGDHSIRGFDAATGAIVTTVAMAANSQPGDLAFARGKLYVAEEFGTPPAIAIVDPQAGVVVDRLTLPAGARPHHVHASVSGNLIAAGLFGTDMVAVVDTHHDTVLGLWDSNPLTTTGRVHAAVFSKDGNTLYLAVDVAGELVALDPHTGHVFWRMPVPGVHEIAVTHNGQFAYVSRRSANTVALVDLDNQTFEDVLTLALPDTLRLSANETLLTVGLRSTPAQLAVVDTSTFAFELVTLSPPGETTTIAGHQWTSPSGRFTFAAYEGGATPGIAVIDHADAHRVVQALGYAGRPHGVDRVRP